MGRGFLVVAAAKAYFIVSSAILNLGLPRLLGDSARFGDFRVVNSVVSLLNMVVIVGAIQAVARVVGEVGQAPRAVSRTGRRVQLVVGLVFGGGLWLLADLIATQGLNDPHLAPYFRIGALTTFAYALYAVDVGLWNGQKQFARQARIDILFSTLKLGAITGLVALGFGVGGAFVGFALAAWAITLIGAWVSHRQLAGTATGPRVSTGHLLVLLLPMLASTAMLNLLLSLDGLWLKRSLHRLVAEQYPGTESTAALRAYVTSLGRTAMDGALSHAELLTEATSALSGLFGAAKNLALLPYQATYALTLVVFPMVANAGHADPAAALQTVRRAMRFTLLLGATISVPLAAAPAPVLTLLFGAPYTLAADALQWLLLAAVLLSLFILAVTVLSSIGGERRGAAITLGTVALQGVLLALVLDSGVRSLDEPVLARAAMASAAASALGLALAGWSLHRRLGAPLALPSLVRTAVSAALALGVTRVVPLPSGILGAILAPALAGGVFVLGLWLLREVGAADLAIVQRVLRRRP